MNTTKQLFSPFYREVGNPYRRVIYNYRQFLDFVIENNGIADCFVSVYDKKFNIDKLFFDLDIMDIELAGKFYRFVTEEMNLSCIPVASGKKGFHFYVLFKPIRIREIDEAVALLRKVSYTIIEQSKLYKNENGQKVSYFDDRVIGDIKRLTRIPNTMRIDCQAYCTYLPPDFYNMSREELFSYIKQPHDLKYNITRRYTINDIETSDAIYDFVVVNKPIQIYTERSNIDADVNKILKLAMRPCIYRLLITENPPHDIRVMATVDLLHGGFTVREIVDIYSKLNWCDFSRQTTEYHVKELSHKVYGGRMNSYPCKEIRRLGFCLGDECTWY